VRPHHQGHELDEEASPGPFRVSRPHPARVEVVLVHLERLLHPVPGIVRSHRLIPVQVPGCEHDEHLGPVVSEGNRILPAR